MTKATGIAFFFGMFWGIYFSLSLDYHGLHYGIVVGTAALAAACYLVFAMETDRERSWVEYFQYEDLHRGANLRLPFITYVYMLIAAIAWGTVSVLVVAFGS
jgi:hypothetical protein